MITIKPVSTVPAILIEELNDYSRMEWDAAGNEATSVLFRSFKVWLLHENETFLGLAGAIRLSLLGEPPTLWLLTSKSFRPRHAKQMRFINETIRELIGEPMIAVAHDDKRAKFLEFIGFTRVAATPEGFTLLRIN